MKPRSTRADGRRSHQLLLEAGAAAFTERGIDVQVSEITRRAGLSKAAFFRHFPTKRALLVAILVEYVQRLTAIAKVLIAEPADDVIQCCMTSCAAEIAPLRAVIETAILHRVEDPSIGAATEELLQALGQLLTHAKARGEVRGDVATADLLHLLMAATLSSAHFFFRDHPEPWRRYLAITLDGLRPAAANPLPVDAPDLGRQHQGLAESGFAGEPSH